MDSRKYQLQKQIIEALKANDNDLYSLLRSQWAHRFGVDSLEELDNLDLEKFNQKSTFVDNQKIDKPQKKLIENDKPISIKEFDNQKKEIKTSLIESIDDEDNHSYETNSNENFDKVIYENKPINTIKENKNKPVIDALIPLPPKPKYSYLKKWLLKK